MTFLKFQQIQADLAQLLLSDGELENVNVTPRDLDLANLSRLADQTASLESLVHLIERNGRKGCGVIVERPEMSNPGRLRVIFTVIEDRLVNEDPTTGTLKPADLVAQRILEVVGLGYALGDVGTFMPDEPSLAEAGELEPLRAYRVALFTDYAYNQTQRVPCPDASVTDLTVTLTNHSSFSTADVYYTTDASFPGPANPAAAKYSAPFAVASGTVLRWAAYLTDYLPSGSPRATIT